MVLAEKRPLVRESTVPRALSLVAHNGEDVLDDAFLLIVRFFHEERVVPEETRGQPRPHIVVRDEVGWE